MTRSPQPPFVWIPGQGSDEAALARLRQAFPMPKEPMGEAWFMSEERKMYRDLFGDLEDVSAARLQSALADIASGTSSFGPFDEWREWFHYLLPRLIPRSHESHVYALLELLITAFITQHPGGLDDEPYPGFRTDALNTLGRCMMDGACWPCGELDSSVCLDKRLPQCRPSFWYDASPPLSASMFFCLKYLDADDVGPWLESVFAMRSPYWRAQIVVWLIGAHDMLTGAVKQPSDFQLEDRPRIGWDWSHALTGHYTGKHPPPGEASEFLPRENRNRALRAVSRHFTDDVFLSWLQTIALDPDLEAELADLPYRLPELYRASA